MCVSTDCPNNVDRPKYGIVKLRACTLSRAPHSLQALTAHQFNLAADVDAYEGLT